MNKAKRKIAQVGSSAAAVERFAILHADGSVTVCTEDADLEQAEIERRSLDRNVRDLRMLGQIARVRIEVLETFAKVASAADPVCPTCQRPHK